MPIYTVNNFNAGIPEDTYNADKNHYDTVQHLDTFTQPGRLRPYRSRIDASDDAEFIQQLLVASDGELYGLGRDGDTGTDSAQIQVWDSTDWDSVGNGTSPNTGGQFTDMFVEFQENLYFWNTHAGTPREIAKWDISGTQPIVATTQIPASVTNSRGATINLDPFGYGPGYRFDQNDTLYVAFGNTIWASDNSGDDTTDEFKLQLILPPVYRITDMSYWQNYLAIACQHTGRQNSSKVYFWNTFDADPSYFYEIPEGKVEILENVGGNLVAITVFGTGSGSGLNGSGIIANVFNGSEFIQARRAQVSPDSKLVSVRQATKTVKNNQLYFGVDSTDLTTIFRFGNNRNAFSLTPDRNITNDIGDPNNIYASEFLGDTLFVAYDDSGFDLTRDDPDKNFDVTSIYRTVWNPGMSKSDYKQKHKLNSVGVAVATNSDEDASSPASRSVEILYRTDFEATFTSLGTIDTDANTFNEITRETTGNFFPTEFNTIQFELRFTGLSQVIEFAYAVDDTPRIYM